MSNSHNDQDTTVSFEGVLHHHAGHQAIRDGYKGVHWNHIDGITHAEAESLSPVGTPNGYLNVLKSGDTVASACQNDSTAVIKSDGWFTLKSGWFASAWLNDMQVTFTAFRDGVEVGHLTTHLGIDAELVNFTKNFRKIDELHIATSGGTDAHPGDGASHELAMDDVSFSHLHKVADDPTPPDPTPEVDWHHHFLTRGFVHDHHVFLV